MRQRHQVRSNETVIVSFSDETPHDGINEAHEIITLSEPQGLMRLYIARFTLYRTLSRMGTECRHRLANTCPQVMVGPG